MNNLTSIIQLIATAVSTKMTMTLSQRIAAMTVQIQKGQPWSQRMLPQSPKVIQQRDQAKTEYLAAEKHLLDKSQSGTSTTKELSDLAVVVEKLKEKFESLLKQSDAIHPQVQSLGNKRDLARSKYESAENNVLEKAASGTATPDELIKLIKSAEKLKVKFDSLSAQTEDLRKKIKRSETIDAAADQRHPNGIIGQTARKVSQFIRKRIGKVGRQRLKSAKSALNPVNIRQRRTDARAAYRSAKDQFGIASKVRQTASAKYVSAKEAHRSNPTAKTASNLINASGKLDAAKSAEVVASTAMSAARGTMVFAEALSALVGRFGPIGAAIAAVIVSVSVVVGSALAFINQTMDSAQKEIQRFRQERSRYSGTIANAIQRYDMQSLRLQQKSSQETSGSARGVVEATMGLRTSTADRSNRWETIANTVLATTVDIATGVSNVIERIDFITPLVEKGLEMARSLLQLLGIKLTSIEKNTGKDGNVGAEAIKAFWRGNKAQPALKELPRVK